MMRTQQLLGSVFFLFLAAPLFADGAALPSLEKSRAFIQYERRPQSELSKLIYLIDRYKDSELSIFYEGQLYDAATAAKYAKNYLRKNYKKGTAENWVSRHCYRSTGQGSVIYVHYPDGAKRIMKDVMLEELAFLAKVAGRQAGSR